MTAIRCTTLSQQIGRSTRAQRRLLPRKSCCIGVMVVPGRGGLDVTNACPQIRMNKDREDRKFYREVEALPPWSTLHAMSVAR